MQGFNRCYFTPLSRCIILMTGLTPVIAWSQTPSHESETTRLPPVVVTSVMPAAGLVIEADPKQARQPVPASDAADYLKTIPGFSAIRNGGTNGDPVLRGMFGSRLNLLVDGGEMIGACPARMDAPSSYISPENYDRLTVIKGPQSVQYGAGGSAGTILFERDPQYFEKPTLEGDAQWQVGSNGRNGQRLDATAGNSLGYIRLAGNHDRADDYEDGSGHKVPSKWKKWNTDMVVGWTPDRDNTLELRAGTGDGEARYAGRGMDGSQFERESFGLRFESRNFDGALDKLEARYYYNYADHVMDNYNLRTPSGMGMMGSAMASNVDRRTQGLNFKSTWLGDDWQIVAGLDAQTSKHRKRSAMGRGAYRHQPWQQDAEFNQYGVFGEWMQSITEQGRVISGIRLDHIEVDDDRSAASSPTGGEQRDKTLPSGFIRYEVNPSSYTQYYIGVGHAQRFPDYWELFSADQGPAGTANAFDGLEPEKTTQLDVGAQFKQGDTEAWISAYVGQIDDYILFTYQGAGGMAKSTADNVDAQIAGAELGGRYTLLPGLTGEASLAYAWGRNRDDHDPLPQMPPLEARFSTYYEQGDWRLGALWRLVAAQHRTSEGQGNVVGRDLGDSAGFGIFSMNAAYRLLPELTLTAGVDNLFDRTYSEHLNLAGNAGFGFPGDTRFNEPGRLMWGKVDWRF
ncbi:TonB-dependent copper receptor [Terasakiispira papahanaumokuakeensis]|uniref:TonB-dependent copper receptor n=1 Tax=Terasakiispira papahanaumokuakeensis TaxID=197479 RepID=A0A1E2V6B4_9GAMM|nr:TonB-dependent copper receptor [Terasakiispira papahanaumokuakeensis]ODC02529.1 TonB-dependent copper receptor [Terasakiispira papahanaumokuakeensis]